MRRRRRPPRHGLPFASSARQGKPRSSGGSSPSPCARQRDASTRSLAPTGAPARPISGSTISIVDETALTLSPGARCLSRRARRPARCVLRHLRAVTPEEASLPAPAEQRTAAPDRTQEVPDGIAHASSGALVIGLENHPLRAPFDAVREEDEQTSHVDALPLGIGDQGSGADSACIARRGGSSSRTTDAPSVGAVL